MLAAARLASSGSAGVYFDYNSAQLDPGAREILRFAASTYKASGPTGVQVTGFADPSGSQGYNQRLSQRRANTVAAELTQEGVPQSALTVSGDGETSSGPTPGADRRVKVVLGAPTPPPPAS
jgi:outer membrane protein OmpA-like peptidoglycan-associated protein